MEAIRAPSRFSSRSASIMSPARLTASRSQGWQRPRQELLRRKMVAERPRPDHLKLPRLSSESEKCRKAWASRVENPETVFCVNKDDWPGRVKSFIHRTLLHGAAVCHTM